MIVVQWTLLREGSRAEGKEEHFMVEVHLCRCPREAKVKECGR